MTASAPKKSPVEGASAAAAGTPASGPDTIRPPAVAGRFYPASPRELTYQLETCVASARCGGPKTRALGCMVPHAGYQYSGQVAGAVYARLELPARYIILCPRHYPHGQPLAIMSTGAWMTPLGEARIDSELACELKRACPLLREDSVAHRLEHSLEVQLPFLQHLTSQFTFVPIAIGPVPLAAVDALGRALAAVAAAQRDPLLVVASSDMNHYESDSVTRVKDHKAIEKILHLDPRGLYETVHHQSITMCGYAAAVAMLTAAKHLGASGAELVCYATSGDVTGDREEVVGYAGVIVC